jgi:hypothetical protein
MGVWREWRECVGGWAGGGVQAGLAGLLVSTPRSYKCPWQRQVALKFRLVSTHTHRHDARVALVRCEQGVIWQHTNAIENGVGLVVDGSQDATAAAAARAADGVALPGTCTRAQRPFSVQGCWLRADCCRQVHTARGASARQVHRASPADRTAEAHRATLCC